MVELQETMKSWNQSSGSLESDAGYVGEVGWLLFEDEWDAMSDQLFELSDRDKLSKIFSVVFAMLNNEEKKLQVVEIMKH